MIKMKNYILFEYYAYKIKRAKSLNRKEVYRMKMWSIFQKIEKKMQSF